MATQQIFIASNAIKMVIFLPYWVDYNSEDVTTRPGYYVSIDPTLVDTYEGKMKTTRNIYIFKNNSFPGQIYVAIKNTINQRVKAILVSLEIHILCNFHFYFLT